MDRPRRLASWSLVVLLLSPALALGQAGADLIPEDAALAFVINSIAGVRDKGEKFVKDHDLKVGKARPSALFKEVFTEIGVTKGVDLNGPAAVVLPNLKKLKVDEIGLGSLKFICLAIPVADADDMASNFGMKAADLKDGKVRAVKTKKRRWMAQLKGKHLYLGMTRQAVSLVVEGKPVTGKLSPRQKAALTRSDLAFLVGGAALGQPYREALDQFEKNLRRKDGGDNAQSKLFVDALRQMRFVVGGLNLDRNGKIDVIATFNKGKAGDAAKRFLTALRAGPGSSDLVGLPAGQPWLLYGARGKGTSNVRMVRALVNVLFDQGDIDRLLPGGARAAFVQSLETMYAELNGSRAALYPTSAPKRKGQFALVGILDIGDIDKHLAEWGNMVKVLNKASAARGEKGTVFGYRPRAEKLDGTRVDLLTVKAADLPAETRKFYEAQLGPDWHTVRLAVLKNQIAFLIGSDTDLLKQTIANLKSGKKGLAADKLVTSGFARLAPERKIEFHFNVRNIALMKAGKEPGPVRGLTSFALTVEPDRIQLEIVASESEVKPFAALLGLADL